MRQLAARPDGDGFRGLLFQSSLCVGLGIVGSDEGDRKIQVCAALQDEADAPQNAVYLSIGSEAIAVGKGQVHGLLEEFFVAHFPFSPEWLLLPHLRGEIFCSLRYNLRKTLFGHNLHNLVAVKTRRVSGFERSAFRNMNNGAAA